MGNPVTTPWRVKKELKARKKKRPVCGICGREFKKGKEAAWDVNGDLCGACFKRRYSNKTST